MPLTITRLDGADDGAMVTISAPDTSITIQEVYNAIRDFEALPQNLDMRPLCKPKTGGKEALGETSQVGITLQLLNKTTIEFEARAGPAAIACNVDGGNLTAELTWDGTATGAHVGTQLTDTNATFATNGIQPGNTIRNVDDGSTATVISVDSETQITHTALTGGSENDWDIGEAWEIDSVHPFSPTAYTHIAYAQDASATLISNTQTDAMTLEQWRAQFLSLKNT